MFKKNYCKYPLAQIKCRCFPELGNRSLVFWRWLEFGGCAIQSSSLICCLAKLSTQHIILAYYLAKLSALICYLAKLSSLIIIIWQNCVRNCWPTPFFSKNPENTTISNLRDALSLFLAQGSLTALTASGASVQLATLQE